MSCSPFDRPEDIIREAVCFECEAPLEDENDVLTGFYRPCRRQAQREAEYGD